MVDGFGQSQDVDEIALLAHTCALAPQALGDPALVRKLAEQRMALTPHGSPHYIWSVHVLGLAYYHAGLPEKAIECLANGLEENPTWENNVLNWLVLAMAHKRLKHEEEALKWLDKARQWTEQKTPGAGKGAGFAPQGWHWRDWLGVQMLLREAEALLNR